MPRAPATRDQVDAYRFGLRRLEAALVRGDPVPLHEQIRSQRRAAMAGVLLGLLALGGVAVYALVVPRPDWTRQALVVGGSSGAMYAVAHDPDRLVPVANLAAGRLVLGALGAAGSGADPAVPVVVPDDDLARAPRTATAFVPGAVAVHPEGPGIAPRWAVCDEVDPEGRARLVGTTVVGGAAEAAPAPSDTGVLLAVPGGDTYVVVDGRRHRVDPDDRPVLAALGLAGRSPRPASPGLVSGIPEGPPLATPTLRPGRAPAGVPGGIGDVLTTTTAGGATRSFLVLAGGLQEVPALAAQVLTAAGGAGPVPVGPAVVAATPLLDELDLTGWPSGPARWAEPPDAPVVCWTWSAGAEPGVSVLVGDRPPAPADARPVALAQADGAGERADTVLLAPGGGGPVRATVPGQPAGTGPLWLVSATGVGHGVPDDASAAALGITRSDPAPETALRLLPTGPALDVADAARVIDVVDPPGSGGG
ncbi:type VII secretion protein EccB [Pseudonocardia bannensis]|uniref:Type VII secretion protein EccB n=1 Tax=Pseudonocardia bannensis TaxID=630973 RepID=A0A848DIC4_9PSEU|nr:type VII secretion protein EccB [Pseudonocardia bannensis]NMH92299.1 type VII secretion protein EccB [Pseudonocardia bannensis]